MPSLARVRGPIFVSSLACACLFALSQGDARAQTGGTHAFAGAGEAGSGVGLEQGDGLGPYFGDVSAGAALGGPLWEPGLLDVDAGWVGRWERELARRQQLLETHVGKDHRAALALLGLLPALGGEIERARLVELVEGVSSDARRHPLVRGLAVDLRAQLHEDAGEFDQARALYAEQGRVLAWQIVGPFDNANRGGHDQRYAPEQQPYVAGAAYEGKQSGERLEWRPYGRESTLRGGYVSFDEFLRPNEYVTGYATTWVHVESSAKRKSKGLDAVLHMGTGGAHKVWVNGELVGEGQAYRQPNPIQDAYALHLEPGWNRILVKVGCEGGAWGFFAQLRGSDGEALRGIEVNATPADIEAFPPAALTAAKDADSLSIASSRAAALSLRGLFEAAADEARTRRPQAEDELALAEFYSWTGPFSSEDFTERDQAREADLALQSPRSAMFLGHAEDDSARARAAYEGGIARAVALRDAEGGAASYPRVEHAQMLIDLAYANVSLGLERRALELLEQAREVAPDDALIELAHVDQLAGDGFELAALDWLEDLAARYPASASISRERANRELALGRVRAGLALLDAYSADHGGDISVIEQRIDAHLRLGEVGPAVALAREIIEIAPDRPVSWQRLAQLEEAAGDYPQAVAALETAVGLAPSDPALHTSLGLLYSRAGDQGGSVMAFSRSLELNPQQPELRDLLATLGAEADDVFTRYAVELEEVAAAVEAEPPAASWDGREAAILHHMVATRIGSNGLGERLDHRIIKILDERGIESQSRHDFAYEPSESYVEVRRARVYRSDGRIEDLGETRHYMIGSAGYRMYYDQRAVAVTFPSLRVGDIVEVAFVKRDVATRNMFDDYYGDIVPLQSVAPVRHFEYLLEAPRDMSLHFNQSVAKVATVADMGTDADGEGAGTGAETQSYQFVRDNIPGLRTEGGMPGWTDIADYLHVSTYATWDEVGRWYWGLVEGQLLVDDAIREGVREALAELPEDATRRDQVAAIYRHVIDETRYVGLEFGIHGYKPYRTTDIYNRRFGDCKDKASLLKVMLGEIGVKSHLVLVRTRDLGTIAEAPASLSAFNHAIVYVPELDLFMDGTAEHSGAFELPAGDQGASVVIIEDGEGASFRTIPYATPDQNHSEYSFDVRLAADGRAEVRHEMQLVGTGAAPWRAGFEAEEQREDRLTKQLAQIFPGVEVRRASFPDIDDVLAPVRLEAELSVPGWAQETGQGGLRWRVIGQEVQLLRGIAPQPSREQPLVLGVPSREQRELRYELPRGLAWSVSPQPRSIDSAFGRFSLEVTSEASAATVTMTLEFTRARIEPGEYEAFREFLRTIDGALAQAFEAVPAR